MFEQTRSALLTYGQRPAFRVFAAVVSVLLFALFYFREELDVFGYFACAAIVVGAYSVLLGHQLRCQFASYRSQLIPHYCSAHLCAAMGLSLLLIVALGGPAILSGGWKGASYAGMFAGLWFLGLSAFCLGYSYGAVTILTVWVLVMIAARSGSVHDSFIGLLGGRTEPLLVVLLIDVAVSLVLIWRMVRMHEEMPEYRWNYVQNNPVEQQKRRWSSSVLDSGLYKKLWSSAERALDSVDRPLKKDLRSQLRHLQWSHGVPQPVLRTAVVVSVMFGAVHFIMGRGPLPSFMFIFTCIPTLTVLSPVNGSLQKGSLQWTFMLPFGRNEIVAKLGGALLVTVLRSWGGFALGVYAASLIFQLRGVQGVPPALQLGMSLAAQLPMFGIATLALMLRPRQAIARYLILPLAMIPVVLMDAVGSGPQAAVVILVLTLCGVGLTWLSYRRWCEAELD